MPDFSERDGNSAMALNQIPHPHSDSDNEELLSRVSKAADGTDIAYKDMVLCQVESVLMGDPLTPSPSAEPVAWRCQFNGQWAYRSTPPNSNDKDFAPLYASPVSDARGREVTDEQREELVQGLFEEFQASIGLTSDEQKYAFIAGARAALSPSFDKTGGGK